MAYFDNQTINNVWEKATVVAGADANIFRKDYAGAWIKKSDYGNCDSDYGWEIDHQKPVAKGGNDNPSNLVALQWENNRSKGDNYPKWTTSVSSYGTSNVYLAKSWQIK
mgnify:CR=1 FL=1